ncbi:hypothetical protein EV210_114140 [Anaerospora hongkongensis]|uniref:Uncharacterized protein n=1 Tax=Anaerospora hongkongensis TaxID=244830 RepID=A0A4R1Q2B2_9FIRM|nr:hypothetical protein EV210_114140 [Anaerospora hongkongensis]
MIRMYFYRGQLRDFESSAIAIRAVLTYIRLVELILRI